MDAWEIRCAAPTDFDARRLYALEAATLGDADRTPEAMRVVLSRPEQFVYLAETSGQLLGFCAAFETAAPHGSRLELDMLGVTATHRGRGIAQALVHRAVQEALARGVQSFRAVVATDNLASARVFARCGLAAEPAPREMLVYTLQGSVPQPYLPQGWREEALLSTSDGGDPWPEALRAYRDLGHDLVGMRNASGRPVAGAALLTVHTIAYDGLWVEAHWARQRQAMRALARAAVERAKAAALDEVGLLLASEANQAQLWPWVEEGYRRAGAYWVYTRDAHQ
jgi:GNAT superfamily N-acetyltransferase